MWIFSWFFLLNLWPAVESCSALTEDFALLFAGVSLWKRLAEITEGRDSPLEQESKSAGRLLRWLWMFSASAFLMAHSLWLLKKRREIFRWFSFCSYFYSFSMLWPGAVCPDSVFMSDWLHADEVTGDFFFNDFSPLIFVSVDTGLFLYFHSFSFAKKYSGE